MEKDLDTEEGIKKIRKIIEGSRIGMMATNLVKIPFSVCPMTTLEIDDQTNLWFFSSKTSDHFKDIEQDNRVQIVYSNENTHEYLSVFGNAVHIVDEKTVDRLWNPMANTWFEGKDDPNLALLSVNIDLAQYWDSKVNQLVSLMGTVKAKDQMDVGQKGSIDLDNY